MLTKRNTPFLIFFLTLFFLPESSFSQKNKNNFSKVDAYAKSVKGITDIGKLSHKLTSPYGTDIEKVRSIFRWITENIAYDTKEYHIDSAHSVHYSIYNKMSDTVKDRDSEFNRKLIGHIFKNKKAICEGYSILFKVLCDSSGIKAEVISGKSKTSASQIGKAYKGDHAWNSVYLDDKWQMLDATWASGYCDDSVKKFTKKYDEGYFLTAPNKFVLQHYPDDAKKILFPNPPSETQFFSYPLAHSGFYKNAIISFSPTNGIIEGKIGNKITFEIRTPEHESTISVGTKKGSNEVKIKKQEKIITYEYTVTSDKDDVLTIYLNKEAILEYRIIVVP